MGTDHMGTFPGWRFGLLAILGTAALAPQPARAQTLDATATILVAGHADPRDGKVYTVVPAYEALTLTVGDFGFKHVEDFKIAVQGWGLVAFGDPRPGEASTGDLDLGYVEGKVFSRHLAIRLGRQMVAGGAARYTPLDGLRVDLRVWKGLGLTAYGGAPVTPRFGISRGDAAVGGRLFWQQSFDTEIGLSAIHVLGEGRVARQDAAADLRWGLHRSLYLTAYGLLSLKEMRLGEAAASLNWEPARKVMVTVDYRRVAPDLFLPRNSVFSVFSQETRDEAGASLYYNPHPRLRLYGDYRFVRDDYGMGHRGGVKGTLSFAQGAAAGVEVRVLHLPSEANQGYVQTRLFGYQRVNSLFFSLDADAYWLETPIHGQDLSFTAAATAGYDFASGWKIALTGLGDVTPFVERRYEVLARLMWNHTIRTHREVK